MQIKTKTIAICPYCHNKIQVDLNEKEQECQNCRGHFHIKCNTEIKITAHPVEKDIEEFKKCKKAVLEYYEETIDSSLIKEKPIGTDRFDFFRNKNQDIYKQYIDINKKAH